RVQVAHRLWKRPYTGDDEPLGAEQLIAIPGDRGTGSHVLQGLLHGAPVPHPVIDHRDLGRDCRAHTSVPFVLGTPLSVGSSDTAVRSARANALKAASI